jgi:hypothetical protein
MVAARRWRAFPPSKVALVGNRDARMAARHSVAVVFPKLPVMAIKVVRNIRRRQRKARALSR